MADPNQVLAPEPAGAESAYRPLSGLAIAGLTLAGLYVLVVLVSTVAGLIQGAGFFLPNSLLLLPIAAAVLCLLAQRQIRASEGTRAGLALARWGLWLSVFAGLGYFSYYQFTYLAIRAQANAFLMEKGTDSGFFPLLQEGGPVEVNAAFLLALPEFERGRAKPDNPKQMSKFDRPGRQVLSMFRDNYLAQVLRRGGKDCKIEPQGVNDWGPEKGGYKVIRLYRITTPEAILRIVVPVQSSEDDAGGLRKWHVVFQQLGILSVEYTALGQSLQNINRLARVYLDAKWQEVRQGTATETIPDKTDWEKLTQGQGPWKELRDDFRKTLNGGTAKSKNGQPASIFFQPAKEEHLTPWRIEKGKVQFDFQGRINFMGPGGVHVMGECRIAVECKEAVVPPGQEKPDPAHFPPQPHWQIVSFEIVQMGPGR